MVRNGITPLPLKTIPRSGQAVDAKERVGLPSSTTDEQRRFWGLFPRSRGLDSQPLKLDQERGSRARGFLNFVSMF